MHLSWKKAVFSSEENPRERPCPAPPLAGLSPISDRPWSGVWDWAHSRACYGGASSHKPALPLEGKEGKGIVFIISWMELQPESPQLLLRESYEEISCLPEGLGLLCISPEGRSETKLLKAAEGPFGSV